MRQTQVSQGFNTQTVLQIALLGILVLSVIGQGLQGAPQRGCTSNLMKAPVNLAGSTTFQKFDVKTEFSVVSDVWFHLNKRGQYEINSDFGTIILDGEIFTLTRLTFIAESETKLKGAALPLEVQIEGQSKTGKPVVLSVLFRKSLVANPTLMKLGIGVGLLKEIGKQARSREKKVDYRFSLNSLFRNSVDFIRFQGSAVRYPCGPAEWLVLHHTLPINEIQIEEFPKIVRYRTKELDSSQTLVQNFDPNLSGLGDFEEFSIRKTKYFVNVLLDNHLPAFQFVPSPPVKPKPKPKKVRKVPTKEEIEREKRMKRAKQLMFSPFAIYEPKAGLPWGYIPDIAIMPWEVKDKLIDKDKMFFLFKKLKVASPKVGYHYIPLYYAPTAGANIVDKKLVFVPYLVLVKNSQKELDVPTLGIYVWNIELQRQHFVRIRHTFGGKKIKVDRDLSEHIFNHPKPPVEKPVVIPPKGERMKMHDKWIKNETSLINEQLKLAQVMTKEVNEIERKRELNKSILKPAQKVSLDGGFKEAVVPKHKTENELKIEKLSSLIDEIYERKSVGKRVDFITNTFPLIESDPGEYPSDAVPVNKKLPANSLILNLKLPPVPVKDSKYIPLFFGPTPLHTRSGQMVWIPNYILVPNYFGLPMDADTQLPTKVPSYVARDPFWEDYDAKVFPLGQIALSFDKVLADKSVLQLPFTESHHYTTQEVFNSLVEQKTRRPNTMRDILSKNEERIQGLLEALGEDKPINHSIPLGAQLLAATGRPHLNAEGKPVFRTIQD